MATAVVSAVAPAAPKCRLCDALLPKCRERRLLSSDNSKQVVHKAAQLLSESVPGRMLYDADVEAYLKEPAAIDSQETAVYLCKRPCFVQLERMVKLEHELEVMKQEIVGRMKQSSSYRELRKRIAEPPATPAGATAATNSSNPESTMVTLRAKKRLLFTSSSLLSETSAASPSVTVSRFIDKIMPCMS